MNLILAQRRRNLTITTMSQIDMSIVLTSRDKNMHQLDSINCDCFHEMLLRSDTLKNEHLTQIMLHIPVPLNATMVRAPVIPSLTNFADKLTKCHHWSTLPAIWDQEDFRYIQNQYTRHKNL